MASQPIKPWMEVVSLHPDVLSESFSEDIFALDLGSLADGNTNVPPVYRDAEHFFRASYLTKGLRSLLKDVLSRLEGGEGGRVLKMVTPFGGGKSHTLAALYHAARSRKALSAIPEAKGLPEPGKVRTAVFDGLFFDATNGKRMVAQASRLRASDDATGTVALPYARTMWGWIAWSLGGQKGYELLRKQDETRVAPGADELRNLLEDGPNLILLDEVLNYLISAGGVKVEKTTLRDETMTFLQRLTVAVGNTRNTALVFSLQSSKRESLEYVSLLQTVDHLAARKDQRREPVEGNEILAVIQRRLLAKMPDEGEATPAAAAYQEIVTQMRRAYARSASEQQQAEEEGIALRDRVRAAYPFHPALIDLMRERWAAIPDFQRTRGALRFLAACLRAAHREGRSRGVLGPGDVPIHDPEVRLAFFKEVGRQADFQAVLEHDLVGANARVKRIDQRRAKEVPAEAAKRPAARLATAILMYSFGGLSREVSGETPDVLPPGVSEAELLSVCVGPDLDSTTALACLKELKEQCLYLHFDGARYCFKKDPNVTLLIEQETDAVARHEKAVEHRIKEMLEERLAGPHAAIVWPEKSGEIPDKEPAFVVAHLPLEFGAQPRKAQQEHAKQLLERDGEKPRSYKNGLGLAVPSADQIEILRRAVRYMMGIEQVQNKAKQYKLTGEQKDQLRERASTEAAAAESALMKLYTEVWLPKMEAGVLAIEPASVGGRPLQVTVNEKKKALIHERIVELLGDVHRKVHTSLTPAKIVELFKLGEQPAEPSAQRLGVATSEVVDGLYSFLGFPRLWSADALRKTIARGIKDRAFGYVAGSRPPLGPDGKYQVAEARVRYGLDIGDDEVDLESGFLMLGPSIPQPAPVPAPGASLTPQPGGAPGLPAPTPPAPTPVPPPEVTQKVVEIVFSANGDQLFTAWNAVANLADMAGRVSVTVKAESAQGFDRSKLQNGVMEPLKEADLIE